MTKIFTSLALGIALSCSFAFAQDRRSIDPGITKRSADLPTNLKELSDAHYLLLKVGITVSTQALIAQIAADPAKAAALGRVLENKVETPAEKATEKLVAAAVKQTMTFIFHECVEAKGPECANNARAEFTSTLRRISKMNPDELKRYLAGAESDVRLLGFLSGKLEERIAYLNLEREVFLKAAVAVMTAQLRELNARKPRDIPTLTEVYLASGKSGTVQILTQAQVSISDRDGAGTLTESIEKSMSVARPPEATERAPSTASAPI